MKNVHSLFAVALAVCAGAVVAGPMAEMSIINRSTGERLETWEHQGRVYVVGRPGDRYAVEIRSYAQERLLAVLSVDGVNAITGETAAGNQSGYILESRQRAEILGWRKSMDDVAAFYFTALPNSYAARTGRPGNVGVVGVALYREYVEAPVARPAPRIFGPDESAAAPAASPAPEYKSSAAESGSDRAQARARREDRLGTGHGERVASSTQYADFRRASDRPVKVMTIYYDSHANLLAQGVIPGPRRPQAFPGGFVPDPS